MESLVLARRTIAFGETGHRLRRDRLPAIYTAVARVATGLFIPVRAGCLRPVLGVGPPERGMFHNRNWA